MTKLIFFVLGFLCVSAQATDNIDLMAKKVIELRKEVELLNDEYEVKKESSLNRLRSLISQKSDLESQIRSEEIRASQLNKKIASYQESIKDTSVEGKSLRPIVMETLDHLQESVAQSLPFKTSERLEAIRVLRQRMERKEVTPMKATSLLWALIEDEKRLSKETSIHKQTLNIGGKMMLAEVAKIGMVFMYFRADNGQVGVAVRRNSQWAFVPFSEADQTLQVTTLFNSLKKQIRQGPFSLPTTI